MAPPDVRSVSSASAGGFGVYDVREKQGRKRPRENTDHPGIDVKAVGDPESDKVPGPPNAPRLFDRFQVFVGELHEGETRSVGDTKRHIEEGEKKREDDDSP